MTTEKEQLDACYEALEAFALDKWGTTNPVLVMEDEKPLRAVYSKACPYAPSVMRQHLQTAPKRCGKPLVQAGNDGFCTKPEGHDGACIDAPAPKERAAQNRPQHGDVWLRLESGQAVAVLSVCGTSGEAIVSGHVYPNGSFAERLDEFLNNYLHIGIDPDSRS